MQFSFWIWLAVAWGGIALGLFWRARDFSTARRAAPNRLSRVFQTVGTANDEAIDETADSQGDLGAFGALLWPLLWGGAALFSTLVPVGATGNFPFEAHRTVWWNWTAGLFCGALLGGAARFWAPVHCRSALLGLGAMGAAMALFGSVEATRGARIEALLGLASGWILTREDDDSLLIGVAATLASLALLRDARASDTGHWALTAGVATLAALGLMAGTFFAARARWFWVVGSAIAGVLALQAVSTNAAASVATGGASCGLVLAWHARQNVARGDENSFPFATVSALALALGANTILQGYGVALGTLMAGAMLWALGERILLPRVVGLGVILALYRLIEARETSLRVAPFGDFTSLWALGATATLIMAATSPSYASKWRFLVTPALIWTGLAALLILWGERAVAGAVAGCLVAVIFGSNLAARGAVLGALWLAVWLALGLELSGGARLTRIGALLMLAIAGALGAAFASKKRSGH